MRDPRNDIDRSATRFGQGEYHGLKTWNHLGPLPSQVTILNRLTGNPSRPHEPQLCDLDVLLATAILLVLASHALFFVPNPENTSSPG